MEEKITENVPLADNSSRKLQDDIFYTPTEFAKLRNCSVSTALNIYNFQDFPSENFGKEKVALGSAIREWYKYKRIKES
jgi:hypothetical protein